MSQWKKLCLYIAVGILAVLFIKYSGRVFNSAALLISIAMPLIMGCVIAYILNILVVKFEKLPFLSNPAIPVYKFRRGISIAASISVIAFIILMLINIIIPQLTEAFRVLISNLPYAISSLALWAEKSDIPLPQIQDLAEYLRLNWPQMAQKILEYLKTGMGDIFVSTVSIISGVGSVIVQAVLAFIFALYILTGKERLKGQFISLLKVYVNERISKCLIYVLSVFNEAFTKFIAGQCAEAVIIGVLCTLGMTVLGLPYAAMIGTIVGATALLPVVGAYIGAFVGIFMIITISPVKALVFAVFIVILQQLEGSIIYPRVVGSSIGLPGIWVLASVTIGGGLGGIFGMFLSVPVTAAVYKLLQNDVSRRKNLVMDKKINEE